MNNSLKLSILEKIQWTMQRGLASIVGMVCECRWRWVKSPLIRAFIYFYRVDLKDYKRTQAQDYVSLNDFFTRSLQPTAQPFEKNQEYILSPVNGCISQIGKIEGEVLLQAKGKTYTLYDLLVGDESAIDLFRHGSFCTFYLAPSDYHRVHMPIAGNVVQTTYVPGFLFSVGTRNTQQLSQLFTRNERIITLFKTEIGPMMMIQVGSCFVGHMGTTWEEKDTTPRRNKVVSRINYLEHNHHLEQGDEMGYFKLGSTVITLFAPNAVHWNESLYVGEKVRYGERVAKVLPRGIEPLFTP